MKILPSLRALTKLMRGNPLIERAKCQQRRNGGQEYPLYAFACNNGVSTYAANFQV
ncbi:MAG: hypothetical protein IJR44_06815 [Neisseriaceae bacterium]|nr:hypothetical protein [Neisseriaceae bacterium]